MPDRVESQTQQQSGSGGKALTRVVALVALIPAVILVFIVLFGGDSGTQYRMLFQNGGQLVPGNQVQVAGHPIGTINSIDLTDDAQAEVEVTVDEPLKEGSTAIIRTTSLSGVANRYISVDPGPDDAPELGSGTTLTSEKTTAPVDLDQLFNTFDKPTRTALQQFIQGQGEVYTGNNAQARATYKYFGPSLQAGERLLAELTRDQRSLTRFLTAGSNTVGAIAERRDDLSALTENANTALGAIATENDALDRSLTALPPALRQGNTTFLNLRAALDDLDPLVQTSLRVSKPLPGFLRDLRPVANDAVPVVRTLREAVARPGAANDLTDVLRSSPELRRHAKAARISQIDAMNATQDDVELARPYTPDFTSTLAKLGQAAGYYDADGHYLRAMPVATNAFDYVGGSLEPGWASPSSGPGADQLSFFTPGTLLAPSGWQRCPGAGTQPASDGSSPFVQPPQASNGATECDPTDVPPGP